MDGRPDPAGCVDNVGVGVHPVSHRVLAKRPRQPVQAVAAQGGQDDSPADAVRVGQRVVADDRSTRERTEW